jgi:hypothetical protein
VLPIPRGALCGDYDGVPKVELSEAKPTTEKTMTQTRVKLGLPAQILRLPAMVGVSSGFRRSLKRLKPALRCPFAQKSGHYQVALAPARVSSNTSPAQVALDEQCQKRKHLSLMVRMVSTPCGRGSQAKKK